MTIWLHFYCLPLFLFQSHRGPGTFFFLNTYVILYSNSVIFTQCYFLMFLLNLCQLHKWSWALPRYEDVAVILIHQEALLPLVSSAVFLFAFEQKNSQSIAASVDWFLPVKRLCEHTWACLLWNSHWEKRRNAPFTPPLRLSVVKRKRICILSGLWSEPHKLPV